MQRVCRIWFAAGLYLEKGNNAKYLEDNFIVLIRGMTVSMSNCSSGAMQVALVNSQAADRVKFRILTGFLMVNFSREMVCMGKAWDSR